MNEYDGNQLVGIDLHRQRSVIVRQTAEGEQLSAVRIVNDPVALGLQIEKAGPNPEVVLAATYGWYWAVDALQAAGATVHLAHPLGVKGFRYRMVKNDVRDAGDLADLLRMNRLPEAWIAPPATRELRELVRYRAKLVALRSGLKAQVHAVLAKAGVLIPVSDLFGVTGRQRLARVPLGDAYAQRVISLLELIDDLDAHAARFTARIAAELRGARGYAAIQTLPGVGPTLAAVFVAEIGDVHRFADPAHLCSWAGLTCFRMHSEEYIDSAVTVGSRMQFGKVTSFSSNHSTADNFAGHPPYMALGRSVASSSRSPWDGLLTGTGWTFAVFRHRTCSPSSWRAELPASLATRRTATSKTCEPTPEGEDLRADARGSGGRGHPAPC